MTWFHKKQAAIPQSEILRYADEVRKPLHDWDGTVVPRIQGNAKAYLAALGALKPEDVLPNGRGHTDPIDIATARPKLFHGHIRSTADRLKIPLGDIHHAPGDKVETVKKLDRPIIDDDEKVRAAIAKVMGDDYAIEPTKEAATEEKPPEHTAMDKLKWFSGGALGLPLASALGLNLPYLKLIGHVAGAPVDAADRKVMRNLKDTLRSDPSFERLRWVAGRRGDSNLVRNAGINMADRKAMSHYDSATKQITLAKGLRGPAILAHEMGHRDAHLNNGIGPGPIRGINISSLMGKALIGKAMTEADEDTSRNWSLAGTALHAPQLLSELDASRRGYNLLRGAGSGKLRALKAGIGLPTYLLSAGTPMAAFGLKKLMGGYDEQEKQANKFSELWRAGKLSRDAVRKITGISSAAAKPRTDVKFTDALTRMRQARGKLEDLNVWGPADKVYKGNVAEEVNRRVSGLAGTKDGVIDVMSGFPTERPAWLDAGDKMPRLRSSKTAGKPASDGPWRNYQNIWDSSAAGPSYNPDTNVLLKAKPGTPEMRHELGHWKQTMLNYDDPVRLHTDTRRALREIGKADPNLRSKIEAGGGWGANDFISELQGHMYGAQGKGGQVLRDATANNEKSVRGLRSQLPAWERPAWANLRRTQAANLAKVRGAASDVSPSTLSALEHLVRNYRLTP